jgi:hypothetical protein
MFLKIVCLCQDIDMNVVGGAGYEVAVLCENVSAVYSYFKFLYSNILGCIVSSSMNCVDRMFLIITVMLGRIGHSPFLPW